MPSNRIKLIDLFSGAGGFTLGFQQYYRDLLEPIWANDIDESAAATYNANFGDHCVVGDLVDLLQDPEFTVPKAEVVIGGYPCQGFSLLNKNRENDPRKALWLPFMEVVERSQAHTFVIENVRQLYGSAEHESIKQRAAELGFQTTAAVLLAADYGVPQMRYRVFIVGSRNGDPANHFPPQPTHFGKNGNGKADTSSGLFMHRTVRDAIADLPPPIGTQIRSEMPPLDLHFGRNPTEVSKRRYRAIPEEGMNRFDLQERAPDITPACWIRKKSGGTDLFGRLWWDRPAFTIRTEFYKPEKGRYLHPEQHRPITHREAARFQSFPDTFQFVGTKIEIARQIGNAVPPQLAYYVASALRPLLMPVRT